MRKRKKTATPGCTTPGKSTHTSCRGGTVQSRPPNTFVHLKPQTKTRHSLPTQLPAPTLGYLCLHSRDPFLLPLVWWRCPESPPEEGTSATWSLPSCTHRSGGA